MESGNPKTVSVNVCPGFKDIFAYKMYHTFFSAAGVLRLLISAAFVALGIWSIGKVNIFLLIVVFLIGSLNVVVTPLMFLTQSISAADTAIPVTYTFSADKITAYDGKNRAELYWDKLALVVWMKKRMLIYTTPAKALVLPRKDMNGKDTDILAIIKAAGNPDRTVIRKFL